MEEQGSLFPPSTNVMKLATDSKAISYVIKYLAKAPIRLKSIKPGADGQRQTTNHYYQPKIKNGVEYMAEYRPIEGRVWGCSDGVRECRPPVIALTERTEGFLDMVKQSSKFRYVQMDRAQVFIGNTLGALREYDRWLWTLWRWHHLATFRYLYGDRDGPPSGNYYDLSLALTECYR